MPGSVALWAVLLFLLAVSALVCAWETALFSLTPAEARRAGPAAQRLLSDSRRLLAGLLFTNLTVQFLFFALAARLAPGAGPAGARAELWVAVGSLFAVVLLGEVFPKTLALRARVPVARVGGVALEVLVRALSPALRAAELALELAFRALGPAGRREGGITAEELARALEQSAEHGLLLDTEAEILSGIAELESVRVREIMTPRVDLALLDVEADEAERGRALASALARKDPWIVAVEGGADRVLGRVRARDLLLEPERPPRELIQPILFVPEVASALHLLEFLREKRASHALAVDEWGGTAGAVTLEDVFEQIVGDLRVEGEAREAGVRALGQGRWLVPGSLSIRDWNELFGMRLVPRGYETVGGFVAALLGRLPREGDEAQAGGLVFRVREVRGRRIHGLELAAAGKEAEA